MPRLVTQDQKSSQSFMGNTVSQHIVPTTPLAIGTTGGFTFGAWVRLNRKTVSGNSDSHTLMVANFNYSNNLGYLFQVEPILGRINIFTGSTIYASGNNVVAYNKWNYIVYELVGTTANVYVNDMVTPAYTVSIVRKADSTLFNRFGSEDVGTGAAVRRLYGSLGSYFAANRVLTSIEKAALMNGTSVPSGLGVYYKLDEGSGTTATDTSGNNNSGTITNGTWSTDTPSKLRTAASNRVAVQDIKSSLSFNGTSSYMTSPVVPDPNGFSFGLWVKTEINLSGSTDHYVSINSAAFTNGFGLQRNTTGANVLKLRVYNGITSLLDISSAPLSRGQWSHIACSYLPSGVCKIYTNGVLTNSSTSTGTMGVAVGQNMTFFKRSYTGIYTNGSMSGFVFQNTTTPWTQEQITALYQNGTIPLGATCVLPINEGAGTTAYDSSGNGNNGTITAGSWTRDTPTKKRKVVNGNMVYNGDFEIAPVVNVPTTTVARWIDGTAAGSTTNNIFGWGVVTKTGTAEAIFDSTSPSSGTESMKVSTTATASKIQVGSNGIDTAGNNRLSCISVLPSTSYTLTFRMKTQLNSGTATGGAKVAVNTFTGAGAYVGTPVLTTAIKTTTDWTTYTSTFTTSETVRLLAAYLVVDGSGGAATLIMDAWFDDIVLTPTTPTTRSAA